MNILVIEDNPDLVANIEDFFAAKGHQIKVAYNGSSGLRMALHDRFDAVVLDLMLPGIDGLEVCARLREEGKEVPVLMLTAKDRLEDKLDGFNCGADDYLVKPFALQELNVRLQAMARRNKDSANESHLRIADLSYEPESMKLVRAGHIIDLPPIPLKILLFLLQQSPRVVSKQEITQSVWGESTPDSGALGVHVHTLRAAIDRPFKKALLRTVRGMGYQLIDPDVAQN